MPLKQEDADVERANEEELDDEEELVVAAEELEAESEAQVAAMIDQVAGAHEIALQSIYHPSPALGCGGGQVEGYPASKDEAAAGGRAV